MEFWNLPQKVKEESKECQSQLQAVSIPTRLYDMREREDRFHWVD